MTQRRDAGLNGLADWLHQRHAWHPRIGFHTSNAGWSVSCVCRLHGLAMCAKAHASPFHRQGDRDLLLDPLESILAEVQQIPEPRQHMVRYHGAYAGRKRRWILGATERDRTSASNLSAAAAQDPGGASVRSLGEGTVSEVGHSMERAGIRMREGVHVSGNGGFAHAQAAFDLGDRRMPALIDASPAPEINGGATDVR